MRVKTLWRDRNATLDAERDATLIYRNLLLHEFPWDINQALSLALFRTYAVPSIGRLLDETGQFTTACQKRYDDTVLLLECPVVAGFDSPEGRTAVRRINQIHHLYDISNDDLRYVLATFIVVPKRWLDDHGWRALTDHEVSACVHHYRALARHMAIRDVPGSFAGFEQLMEDYEREHFAYDPGSRRVADATLALLASFYPQAAARTVDVFSRALMDPPLLAALRYDDSGPLARTAARAALQARARVLAVAPSRRRPRLASDTPRIRSYPGGHLLADLGTFPPA